VRAFAELGTWVVFGLLVVGCRPDSGKELANVADGGIVPPSTVLMRERPISGSIVHPPGYARDYRSDLSRAAVNDFYNSTLVSRGWQLDLVSPSTSVEAALQLAWNKGNLRIRVIHGTENPDDYAQPTYFQVKVSKEERK
jgi:hypothetical protein